MSNLSSGSKHRGKNKKHSSNPPPPDDNHLEPSNGFHDKQPLSEGLPFELKLSKRVLFFSPKVFVFVSACLIILVFSETLDFFQKYSVLFPSKYSSYKPIFFIYFAVVAFGLLFFPNSYFRRPHKTIWRFILASALCYLALILFVLFQSREEVMKMLHDFDPTLGKPLPEKTYAADCRIYTPENAVSNFHNIKETFDVYIIAHLLGWWVKMMIVRDWKFCFFLSSFFEFLEITFRHWLPNFYECWWDHIIVDIIVCNGLGIYLGELTIKYFKVKRYHWLSLPKNGTRKTLSQNFKEIFTVDDLRKHDWIALSSLNRYSAVLWYVGFMMLVDLSNFFNKFVLWIPPSHIILQMRVYLWGLIAMSSTREYYEYIYSDGEIKSHCWICHLMLFVEYCILFKFSHGFFQEPFPSYVVFLWSLIIMGLCFLGGLIFIRTLNSKKIKT